jgi:hypothetical protein
MATIIAIPILAVLTILQSTIVSRLPVLQGTADIVLLVLIAWALQERVRSAWQWSIIGGLFIGFVTVLHFSVPLLIYLVITGIVLIIRERIWNIPILVMFVMTFMGSLFSYLVSLIAVIIGGVNIPVFDSIRLILLPSLILNLLLAAPIYAVIKDLAEWLYPEEIKI